MINKLKKSMASGVGSDINITKTQITKALRHGGSLWSSLFLLGSKLLPRVAPYATKALSGLATGALSSLGSLATDKIFGRGQTRGFMIPQNKIAQLIAYKHLLCAKQKQDTLNALQSGSGVVIKPTVKQRGGFLGTLLASIGIPLLMNASTGKGLHVDRNRQSRWYNVYVPPSKAGAQAIVSNYPPTFIVSWNQPIAMGVKKKDQKRRGLLLGKKSPFNSIPILGQIF